MSGEVVLFNGKKYDARIYSMGELESMFMGYIVVLDNVVIESMRIRQGKLVGVCTAEEKDSLMEEYTKLGKSYIFLDLCA